MAKKAAAPVDDDEVGEIEEVGEDEGEETPAADAVWGVRDLIALIKEKTGKEYKPREVRTLLRKLAREDGVVNREIIPGNKTRYSWEGPNDPEVRAVLKAVKGGAIEASKKAALDKLKADKAAQNAAKKAQADKAAKAAKKAAPEPDDDDDDD